MCLSNYPLIKYCVPLIPNKTDSEGLAGLCHRTRIDRGYSGRIMKIILEQTLDHWKWLLTVCVNGTKRHMFENAL